MQINEAIAEIINGEGIDVLKNARRLNAIIADLAPESRIERNVFKAAVDDDILSYFLTSDVKSRVLSLSKVKIALSNKGIADNWIEFIIKCISEPLGWSEEISVLFPKNMENAEEINNNKIINVTNKHSNPTKEPSSQDRKQPQKPAVKSQFNDLEKRVKTSPTFVPPDAREISAEEILECAYTNNKTLKRIYIQDSVCRIGHKAFENSSVTEVLGMNGVIVRNCK